MATLLNADSRDVATIDYLSGTPRAHTIDRWIYVVMAGWFLAITLVGFVPDSVEKIAMVGTGMRPPFPVMLHVHAVVMGSFLLLLFAQTWLTATGHVKQHMRLGIAAFVLVPLLVGVGVALSPIMYHDLLHAQAAAAPDMKARMAAMVDTRENVTLNQLRIGILFPLFIAVGLAARRRDAGMHKRMMILATAVALPPAINRMTWLPTTMPASPLSSDLFMLAAVTPMFVWDVIRNGSIHRAYWLWLGGVVPVALAVYVAWDQPWWHTAAKAMMGV